jgi:Regulator of chromosome condensation (RCC1) repeat/PASTA domain
VPSGLDNATDVDAGALYSLALKADGTVVAWGCGFNYGQCAVPAGLAGVTAISAGHGHSLALKSDGTVVAWGCGSIFASGQCSVPGALSGVTAIAAGLYHSVALKSDGTVVVWGCTGHDLGQCSVPVGLAGVTAIAAGGLHSLALKSDGTVVAWGCGGDDAGQCNVPPGLSGVTAISAARTQSLALEADGTVVAWGCSALDYGQCNVPGGLAGVTAIDAGYAHSLALKSDGTVVAWGCQAPFNLLQCSVPISLTHATSISAGDFHSLAIAELLDQTITFDPIANRTWGDPAFTVSATASSGLPVSFTATGACFVTGAIVWVTSAGSCTVTASQPGGLNVNPAPDVSQTFTIARARQSITFGALTAKILGDPDFVVSALSGSGLPVSFAASGSCTVSGMTVHLTGAGFCTVTASQAGDLNWEPAPAVSQTFVIQSGAAPPATPPASTRCRVPAVIGKGLTAAKRMIAKRHCRTGKVTYAYSRKRKKGVVLSQNRRPGSALPGGSRINLVVSRGRKR